MTEDPSFTDIGHGVAIIIVGWHPDRELNPQYADIEDVDAYGAMVRHPGRGVECTSFATFDTPTARQLEPEKPKWTVESPSPLSLSPSILCRACGHHGFIRDGRWVPA